MIFNKALTLSSLALCHLRKIDQNSLVTVIFTAYWIFRDRKWSSISIGHTLIFNNIGNV